MSRGTYKQAVVVDVSVPTTEGVIVCRSVALECAGSWDHDAGCMRTSNGDGWPPSLYFDCDITNEAEALTRVRACIMAEHPTRSITDAEILDAMHIAANEALASGDVREHDASPCCTVY